jgi:hypothetical protein
MYVHAAVSHRSLCKTARDAAPQLITALHLHQADEHAFVISTAISPDSLPWKLLMSLSNLEALQFEGCSTATHILLQTHNPSTLKRVSELLLLPNRELACANL